MKETYYIIKTRHFEDYAMDLEDLAETIALHEEDQSIYCVETITKEIEDDETEDYWTHPSLTAAERNR